MSKRACHSYNYHIFLIVQVGRRSSLYNILVSSFVMWRLSMDYTQRNWSKQIHRRVYSIIIIIICNSRTEYTAQPWQLYRLNTTFRARGSTTEPILENRRLQFAGRTLTFFSRSTYLRQYCTTIITTPRSSNVRRHTFSVE